MAYIRSRIHAQIPVIEALRGSGKTSYVQHDPASERRRNAARLGRIKDVIELYKGSLKCVPVLLDCCCEDVLVWQESFLALG